jgi:hypothetical protein
MRIKLRLSKAFVLRFFILGLAIFLILGISILMFLDKYYLVDNSHIKGILTSSTTISKVDVSLPSDAQGVSFSADGDYMSYTENNNIQVVDLNSGVKKTVVASDSMSISFYKWVSDRDRLILAEKSDNDKYFKLYYYDVVNNDTVEIADAMSQSIVKITANGKSDAVTDIQMSTLTNLIYVKMTNSSKVSHLYKIDIMVKGGSIYMPYNNIGTINLLKGDDKLLYENLDNNKIYLRGRSAPFTVDKKKYFKVLGSDDNDVIYLAEYDNDSSKTSNFYYGNDTTGWTKVTPNLPVNISDVFVSNSGQIYVNDVTGSALINFKNNSQTKYSGKFLGIYSDGIISVENNQVLRTKFSQ